MSRLVARILLCMFMFPLAVVVYCATVLDLDRSFYGWYYRGPDLTLVAGVVTWGFVIGYWTLLWRKSVRWTVTRVVGPFLLGIGGAFVGLVAQYTLFGSSDREGHEILLGISVPTLWLICTVFLWRETAAERSARLTTSGVAAVSCPVCGYNLTGLSESRCPECGSKFTLDELLASQPQHAMGEID